MSTNFFAVATAGATVDGREITSKQLREMAASYSVETYGARVWNEHIRGILPDSLFKALGDVVALKTRKNKDGQLQLLAQISPTAELVALNEKRQKVFTSIEINPNFCGTGKAYLVGLAVTDSPASTGTEMLKFNLQHNFNNAAINELTISKPFKTEFKMNKETENQTEEIIEPKSDEISLFNKFKNMFASKEDAAQTDAAQQDISNALELFAEQINSIKSEFAAQTSELSALKTAHEQLQNEFAAQQQKLDAQAQNYTERAEAFGDIENEQLADC